MARSETDKRPCVDLKNKDTPVLQGYQIFHNHIRPQESLPSKTLAEARGIEIKGKNKWLILIQNASKKILFFYFPIKYCNLPLSSSILISPFFSSKDFILSSKDINSFFAAW